jgi:hypothetical protein
MAMAVACAAVVGVAAQSETTVTVTGCVQNISSTTPAGETTHGFLLSNAALADSAADAGARGRLPSTATASFLLDGRDGDLKDHVGHKVEVTGTVDASVEMASEPPRPPTGAAGTGAKTMDQQQRLHVSAVKMVASSCQSK